MVHHNDKDRETKMEYVQDNNHTSTESFEYSKNFVLFGPVLSFFPVNIGVRWGWFGGRCSSIHAPALTFLYLSPLRNPVYSILFTHYLIGNSVPRNPFEFRIQRYSYPIASRPVLSPLKQIPNIKYKMDFK